MSYLPLNERLAVCSWSLQPSGAKVVVIADKDPKRAAGDLSGGWSNIDGGADALDMSQLTTTTAPPFEMIRMPPGWFGNG